MPRLLSAEDENAGSREEEERGRLRSKAYEVTFKAFRVELHSDSFRQHNSGPARRVTEREEDRKEQYQSYCSRDA